MNNYHDQIIVAQSYAELVRIALEMFKEFPKPIAQVCGPISTGGKESIPENIKVLESTIAKLEKEGVSIFNQALFEEGLAPLKQKYGRTLEEKNQILLEEFHLPLLKSGFITQLYFIHGWESSHGSRWEREQGKQLGLEIIDLPENFINK